MDFTSVLDNYELQSDNFKWVPELGDYSRNAIIRMVNKPARVPKKVLRDMRKKRGISGPPKRLLLRPVLSFTGEIIMSIVYTAGHTAYLYAFEHKDLASDWLRAMRCDEEEEGEESENEDMQMSDSDSDSDSDSEEEGSTRLPNPFNRSDFFVDTSFFNNRIKRGTRDMTKSLVYGISHSVHGLSVQGNLQEENVANHAFKMSVKPMVLLSNDKWEPSDCVPAIEATGMSHCREFRSGCTKPKGNKSSRSARYRCTMRVVDIRPHTAYLTQPLDPVSMVSYLLHASEHKCQDTDDYERLLQSLARVAGGLIYSSMPDARTALFSEFSSRLFAKRANLCAGAMDWVRTFLPLARKHIGEPDKFALACQTHIKPRFHFVTVVTKRTTKITHTTTVSPQRSSSGSISHLEKTVRRGKKRKQRDSSSSPGSAKKKGKLSPQKKAQLLAELKQLRQEMNEKIAQLDSDLSSEDGDDESVEDEPILAPGPSTLEPLTFAPASSSSTSTLHTMSTNISSLPTLPVLPSSPTFGSLNGFDADGFRAPDAPPAPFVDKSNMSALAAAAAEAALAATSMSQGMAMSSSNQEHDAFDAYHALDFEAQGSMGFLGSSQEHHPWLSDAMPDF
jgi:hypothetical protein